MNYATLLPIPEGGTLSSWSASWLKSIANDIQSQLGDDITAIRMRNERFSAYLPMLSVIAAAYSTQVDLQKVEFEKAYPRPEKGVTAWAETRDLSLSSLRRMRDLIVQLHEDIATRLSNGQSSMRTISNEVKHGIQ